MAKGRRQRHQNPEQFLPNGDESITTRKRFKTLKQHQKEENLISSDMSSKILKEALIQQKEIVDGSEIQENPNDFFVLGEEEPYMDEFEEVSECHSQFGGNEDEIDEKDERLLEELLSEGSSQQNTIVDHIVKRIREKDTNVASGKLPKALKHIPSMQLWEEALHLTKPENWSPNAFQATRFFASNMNSRKAERFYKLVLLPRVRKDISKNKRLHLNLYQALKKCLYKPAAFFKGLLFPLCESRTCTQREADIIGSLIKKVKIPVLHSSVALLFLAEMEFCGKTSYFIKLLLEKKYALPIPVVDAVVAHFMRFLEDTRMMPVIWHQSLLAFVLRYKNQLKEEDKDSLRVMLEKKKHKKITPVIIWELDNSRNRDEKEDDLSLTYILRFQFLFSILFCPL
ncbi:Bystin [Quillaja saponaria]|uniref:Bystin n=1 Tax=Quillaja saponaria TaxID=32244 RepID=A0AAD7VMX3_QUISA|nr:Bystin [Quillaja saponaria]